MHLLKVFEFQGYGVMVEYEDGQPLFKAQDVCRVLGYANPRSAIDRHVSKGDGVALRDTIDTIGRTTKQQFVTEAGLYALILGSRRPNAERFREWVTGQVLPEIRKTGQYIDPKSTPEQPSPSIQQHLLAIIENLSLTVRAQAEALGQKPNQGENVTDIPLNYADLKPKARYAILSDALKGGPVNLDQFAQDAKVDRKRVMADIHSLRSALPIKTISGGGDVVYILEPECVRLIQQPEREQA